MGAWPLRLLDCTPGMARLIALRQLFRATAVAFQCDTPRLAGLSRAACLHAYARFTAERAGDALHRGEDLAALEERLYRNAHRLAGPAGRWLRVRTLDDVMAASRFLYGILDIDMAGSQDGAIVIRRCYFSAFYAPDICRVMSAMDRGLLAGLAGGGELVFTQRITEGRGCCLAHFTPEQER